MHPKSARRLHRQGQSARLLARRYGVAHTTVLRILKRNF
ncbi:helix-turn-helix domain-containing protein [Subtercola boreus]